MRRTPLLLRRASAGVLLTGLVALGACGGDRPELAEEPSTTTTAETAETTTTTEAVPVTKRAQALEDRVAVYPDATATEPQQEITAEESTSAPGIPIVFLVKSEGDDRIEVYLPVRPNGSTGWVDRADVELAIVDHRIEVAVAEHRLRLYEGDELVLEEPIGVGRAEVPTPGGVYYLKELLQPPNPNGAYGNYAYGLSGFSTVLESFNGGDGVIGIHGTNEPDKLGTDVSHGCIRVHNDVMSRLVNEIGLPLGTPVEILA
jgi:lipoprotein-anchoring transpeptidase ErfK/SrfK